MLSTDFGRAIRWAFVCAVAAFGACKDDGFGDVPASEAPETVTDTICGQADDCGCFEGMPGERDLCQSEGTAEWQAFIAAGEAEGLTYDGRCIGELLDIYASFGCRTELDEADFDECRPCKFFHGSQGAGQPCAFPESEDLGFSADDCAQGLVCNGDVCVDPCETAGEGEVCLSVSCDEGLTCLYTFENDEESATCVRPAGEGEDCSQAPCADDLDCDPLEATCVPRPPAPSEGEPCNGFCDDDSFCDTSSTDPAQWICVARRGEGEPCSDSGECRNFQCEEGVCAPERPIACLGF